MASGASGFASKSRMSSTFANRRAKVVKNSYVGDDQDADVSGLFADIDTHPSICGVLRVAIKGGKRLLVDRT